MDVKESLWKMLQEEYTHARQHQTQRATMTNIVLVVASALIGLICFDKHLSISDTPASVMVVVLGIFGAVFSVKFQERYSCHRKRAYTIRNRIEELDPECNFTFLEKTANDKSKEEFPILSRYSLRYFWILLHVSILLVGLLLLLLIYI